MNGLRTIASSPHSTPIGAMLTAPSSSRLVTIVSTITTSLGDRSLSQLDVLGNRVVGWREIAPRQRPFLTIGLAERHRQAGARELLAEVKRVRRLDDVELGEEIDEACGIATVDEALVVQDGDAVAI